MKKLTTLILIAIGISANSFSQSIYLDDDFVSATGPADDFITVVNHITNNTSGAVDFRWERIVYDLPQGWDAPFCDKNNCYSSTLTTATFNLQPGESGMLKPMFTPNGVEGIGTLAVRVYSITNGVTFEDTATFEAITEGVSGIQSNSVATSYNIYPTISSGTITITGLGNNVSQYAIHSVTGVVNSFTLSNNLNNDKITLDISSLTPGIYYISIINKEETTFFSKPIIKL